MGEVIIDFNLLHGDRLDVQPIHPQIYREMYVTPTLGA